jgi:hypothetical protein
MNIKENIVLNLMNRREPELLAHINTIKQSATSIEELDKAAQKMEERFLYELRTYGMEPTPKIKERMESYKEKLYAH